MYTNCIAHTPEVAHARGSMPEEPTSLFSLASSNPFSTSTTFSFGKASLSNSWAATPDLVQPKSPEVLLKVKCPQFTCTWPTLKVTLDTTIEAIIAQIRTELNSGDAPITLIHSGKVLSCLTQAVGDVVVVPPAAEGAAMRTITIHCMKKATDPTPPTQAASLTPQAAAAAAAAARAAAAQSAVAGGASTAARPDEMLRVRPLGPRAPLQLPFADGMTALGLKLELQRRGEGPVEQFRLLHLGKELMDQIPLCQQNVRAGATIDMNLRVVPFKSSALSMSSTLTTFSG